MPEFAQPMWLWLLAAPVLLVVWSARRARPKLAAASVLRGLALAALVICLAGPLAGSKVESTDVVFALDMSSSIARDSIAEALQFVNRAKDSPARVGLVVFGADAAFDSSVRRGGDPLGEITSQVERTATDIGRAIEVAVGAFSSPGPRRVVLLSDGRENQGDARAAAAVARSLGVELHTVALERPKLVNEVHVESLTVPPRVRRHEPFTVQTVIQASAATRAHLVVMRNGTLLHEAAVDLQAGANVHSFVQQASEPGLQEYEVIVNSDADSEPENNRYQAFVHVTGAPKVLHAMGDPQSGRHVSAALRAQGLAIDEVNPGALPATLHELAAYDLVILNNVSGFDLSLPKMEVLEHYVRDAGGGVVKLGGERSYAAGGYLGTPVERLLPVTMHVKTDVKIPSLSVVFVLDRSGSMGTKSQGEEKLAIAKRAALMSIDLLNRLDRVGVLAFDSGQEWVVSPTEAAMRRPIVEKLRELQVGGGTDLHRALEEAHRVMRKEQAKVKHLIVLSDGITEGEKNFDRLGARIAADGITISTVALGGDADQQLMERISQLGKGRFYHTDDPANVPRIFTSETLAVARDLVVEGNIRPRQVDQGEPIQGFGAADFPVLGGYQRAFPKGPAHVLLAAGEDDPLLVSWRYGLGKAVAFTSDLSGRWGRRWIEWPEFGRFVSQIARWTMRHTGDEIFVPRFHWQGQRGVMEIDVLDREERFVNGLLLDASVVDPLRRVRKVALAQVSPGRYQAEFPVPRAGRYYITLSGRNPDAPVGPQTFGLAIPYSSEYLDLGADRRLLREVASIAGGRLLDLSSASLSALTAPAPPSRGSLGEVWWPFFLTALVLLVAEVIVRKVPLPEAWRERWERWRGERRRNQELPQPTYEALRALAREQARDRAAMYDGQPVDADDAATRARLSLSAGRRG